MALEGRLWGTTIAVTSHEPLPAETQSRLGEFTRLLRLAPVAGIRKHRPPGCDKEH